MTGSMYAAIAGLRTHMQNLSVIGNNIANVNTQGYKSARAVFKTSIYTTLTGGSNGTTVAGGRNPSQIGYGANVANVGVDMSTGNYTVTGNATDLMLDGAGFFMVGDKSIANNFNGDGNDVATLKSLDLTRVGDLEIKADGYLCNGDGRPVYGFLVIGIWGDGTEENDISKAPPGTKEGDPRFSDQLVPIRKPYVYPSTGTVEGEDGEQTTATTMEIGWPSADLQGNAVGKENASANEGHLLDYGSYVDTTTGKIIESDYQRAELTGITISDTGIITAMCGDRGNQLITIGCIAIGTVTNPNGVTNLGNNYYKAGEGSGDMRVCLGSGTADTIGITHINKSLYDNKNPDETQTGDETGGEYPDSLRIRDTDTSFVSNGLESSKTDLAQEIANMIVTQRGYQANTRIITVTDSMLEELVNMKR